jgi:hypothetical protein
MKNFKKIALSLLVGVMAVAFSSFTNNAAIFRSKSASTTYTFVHPVHGTSNTKADYEYTSDPQGCTNSTNICSATWNQSEVPTEGSNPASDAVEVAITDGNYK